MKTKLLSILLALCMAVGLLPVTALADWVVSVNEGWYVMRCMENFVTVAANGDVELRWSNPATPFYIREFDNGDDIVTTIKTVDGKYLGVAGGTKNGSKVVAQSEPYYWSFHGDGFYVDDDNNPYMLMNASGEKNADGTKLIIWDNTKWTTPLHGVMSLVPASGSSPQYVKPEVVSPFEATKPLTLKASSGNNQSAAIFGMTLDKTTVAEMKALYGEPDDVWYERGGEDYQTAWYFYRNNWTDMMLIGARRIDDTPTVRTYVSDNNEIEDDDCIVVGVYTNKLDLGLSSAKLTESTQTPIVYQNIKDEVTGNTYAAFVGTNDFYWWHCYYYFHEGGAGKQLGAMEHLMYYMLNGYLATKGWKMLALDELASFNLYKDAEYDRKTNTMAMNGKDTGTRSEYAAAEGTPWLYLNLIALEAKKFRAEMWSGKYNQIAIGFAEGWQEAEWDWKNDNQDYDSQWGSIIAKLGYKSGVENKDGNTQPENSSAPEKSADYGKPPAALVGMSQKEWDVLRLTNIERAKKGLTLLVTFDVLNAGGGIRAVEIGSKFSHERPDGSGPNTVMQELGYKFTAFGENIALGQKSAAEVVNDWMNSEGHRANILRDSFRHLGVGNSGNNWVQLFSVDSGSKATTIEYNEALGYFTLTLKSGVTAYAPYDAVSSPTKDGKVTFNYPGVETVVNESPAPTHESTPTTETVTANPTNTKFMLNGAEVALPAYEIGGNNYVKLRDVGALLKTRFDVRWEDSKAKLYNHEAYTSVGGELAAIGTDNKSATLSTTSFVWSESGAAVTGLTAYEIGGNNFIKLRDIAKLFDFDVDWRDNKAWIKPDVSPYTED